MEKQNGADPAFGLPRVEVEFRAGKIVPWKKVDDKTGFVKEGSILCCACERLKDGAQILINTFLPKGATAANTAIPYKKGDRVRYYIEQQETRKGVCKVFADVSELIDPAKS